ncbi:MAG TPA: cache domain-containing protein [Desulfuromonadaceae bacterium]
MGLHKRIQILLAFLVGIPLALLLFESYQTGRKTLVAQMKRETLQVAHLETAEIDLTFEPARLIAAGLARSLETGPALEPDSIRELLRRTLHDSPGIYGAGVALGPALTRLGRFAPYVCRRGGAESEITLPYEYTRWEWYRLPMESGRGRWIKPYFGEGGKALMVTYAAPLRRNGAVVGVVAVDLDLDSLLKSLHAIRPGGDGTVYLVNRRGQILAHPDLPAIADLPGDDKLGDLAPLMKHSGLDTVQIVDPVSHRKSWVVESPLPSLSAKQGGEDWSLIVSWPLDRRMAPLNGMGRRMLVLYLFMGGAALWFLNRIFDDSITRPLRSLAEQARRYAGGDFSQKPVVGSDTVELRELGAALNSLGAALEKGSRPGAAGEEAP